MMPDSAWRAADHNKLLWVLLQVIGVVLGFGLIVTLICAVKI